LSLYGFAALAACSASETPPRVGAEAAAKDAPAPAAPAASAAPAAPAAPGGAPARKDRFPLVAGASCAGLGGQDTSAKDLSSFRREGDTLIRELSWGCGCPTGPVFTMVYEPKTSPLRLRLCVDQSKDLCEAMCTDSVRWDLSAPLRDAGARDIVFADP
jgi:hypothetical protein